MSERPRARMSATSPRPTRAIAPALRRDRDPTPANAITFLRLLFAIPVLVMILGEDPGADVGHVRGLDRALDHRRHRRVVRPARRHDPLGRVPRPAGRQDRSCSAGSSPSAIRGDFAWLPVAIIAGREVARLGCTGRSRVGAASRCRRAASASGRRTSSSSRSRSCCSRRPRTSAGCTTSRSWAAVAFSVVVGDRPVRSGTPAGGGCAVRCDVLAIGTELLLGQIVDTNSAWIGEQLATAGIDTYDHRKVGDNLARMVAALRDLLVEADAVIVCGGLGPTPDDVTREAIAEVMGVELERREDLVEQIAALFGVRGRDMPAEQPAPGRRPGRRRRDPEPDRHRAGPAVPRSRAPTARSLMERRRSCTRCRASPTRCSRWSPTSCCPTCSSVGRACRDRVALAEDVGDVGVGPRRDDRRSRRRADQPDDRVPRPRHRGPLRAADGEGARPRPRRSR